MLRTICTANVAGSRVNTSLTYFGGDSCRNIYQTCKNGRSGSDHVIVLLLVTWFLFLMKELTTVSCLRAAFSELTHKGMDLSDLSRLRQSPLHSQGQSHSFFYSNKRSFSRRTTRFNLPDYRVVY